MTLRKKEIRAGLSTNEEKFLDCCTMCDKLLMSKDGRERCKKICEETWILYPENPNE